MSRCSGCGRELRGRGHYCSCGAHFHRDCLEGHRAWCVREGEDRDRWIGAVEL